MMHRTPSIKTLSAVFDDPAHAKRILRMSRAQLLETPAGAGGYDAGGAYWGTGTPLFWAGDESGGVSIYFRAASRAAAELHVTNLWPGATFNR
jgi:hypothetical protein